MDAHTKAAQLGEVGKHYPCMELFHNPVEDLAYALANLGGGLKHVCIVLGSKAEHLVLPHGAQAWLRLYQVKLGAHKADVASLLCLFRHFLNPFILKTFKRGAVAQVKADDGRTCATTIEARQ
eukprot:CAMPEP_0182846330 /NCGR_PEP_ID=MMETSP0006_2-20121128/27830_1 /TAXON_ID=97485 /ORGANISM="Prymnesium parvum, Strain Texoma1" /LENGTH=122 /DNA_ID=CAMNT_0024976515 /DNA_START=561 /DNA_END=929 /DNA_ORIENTATION=+